MSKTAKLFTGDAEKENFELARYQNVKEILEKKEINVPTIWIVSTLQIRTILCALEFLNKLTMTIRKPSFALTKSSHFTFY